MDNIRWLSIDTNPGPLGEIFVTAKARMKSIRYARKMRRYLRGKPLTVTVGHMSVYFPRAHTSTDRHTITVGGTSIYRRLSPLR